MTDRIIGVNLQIQGHLSESINVFYSWKLFVAQPKTKSVHVFLNRQDNRIEQTQLLNNNFVIN